MDYLRFVPFSRSEILESIHCTYNFKELLTCHPRVEPARIGQYHESDFGLSGELVDNLGRLTTLFIYKCRLLITLVNGLDPDQVKSADDKKQRKYPSMQRVKSTAHGFDWKIEHV